jgi:hypothetical protein
MARFGHAIARDVWIEPRAVDSSQSTHSLFDEYM